MQTTEEIEREKRKLKKLQITDKEFVANGVTYFIEPEISADRFSKMQELEIELTYGMNYKKLFDKHTELRDNLNKMNLVDSCVIVDNLQKGIADIEERRMPILEYCACFINSIDEDRRVYDEKVVSEKIENWLDEGFDYMSFFAVAVNMVSGLKENYLKFTQNTSRVKEEKTQ